MTKKERESYIKVSKVRETIKRLKARLAQHQKMVKHLSCLLEMQKKLLPGFKRREWLDKRCQIYPAMYHLLDLLGGHSQIDGKWPDGVVPYNFALKIFREMVVLGRRSGLPKNALPNEIFPLPEGFTYVLGNTELMQSNLTGGVVPISILIERHTLELANAIREKLGIPREDIGIIVFD